MERLFIELPQFSHCWKSMGLNDDDLHRLQNEILNNPDVGVVMKGTGGLRKMRFSFDDRGKSGSTRVCYVDIVVKETIFLVTAYPKNEKDNLSKEERNNIKKVIERLKKTL